MGRPADAQTVADDGAYMRDSRPLAVLLAFLAIVGCSARSDHKAIQGKWRYRPKQPNHVPADYTFKGTTLFVQNYTSVPPHYEFKLNPDAEPKEIDLTRRVGGTTYTTKGIYRLDGDILILCFSQPDDPRPKSFEEASATEGVYITRLTRAKSTVW